jgi:lysozyme family protein
MADFNISYEITRKIEGGWHSGAGINKHDLGGETFKGIARVHFPNWEGWKIVDSMKKQTNFPRIAETDPRLNILVRAFFKTNFWDPIRLDSIKSQAVADEAFDTGVNMGIGIAARFMQRGVNLLNRNERSWKNLTVDGAIGPKTIETINNLSIVDTRHLFNSLNMLQGARYLDIIEKNPTQEENWRGWLERVELMKKDLV